MALKARGEGGLQGGRQGWLYEDPQGGLQGGALVHSHREHVLLLGVRICVFVQNVVLNQARQRQEPSP